MCWQPSRLRHFSLPRHIRQREGRLKRTDIGSNALKTIATVQRLDILRAILFFASAMNQDRTRSMSAGHKVAQVAGEYVAGVFVET